MEDRCKYRFCGTVLWQNGRGRKREFCDDGCRQAEHRARQADHAKEAARQEVMGWGTFLPATIDQLAGYITIGSRDTARKMANMFLAEQSAATSAASQENYKLKCQVSHLEIRLKAIQPGEQPEQASSKGGRALGKLDRQELEQARVDLRELRKLNNVWGEEIHQLSERCKDLKKNYEIEQGKARELKKQLDQADRGMENVQERFREYVATTNERLSQMAGELAAYRQEKERGSLPENLAKMERMRSQIAELESKLRCEQEANQALARHRNELLVICSEQSITMYRERHKNDQKQS